MERRTLLNNLGLKATPKRLAMLEILQLERRYVSPETLWKRLRRRFRGVGLPTVYRNLGKLEGKGVISKVLHPNRQLYYYFCGGEGHHHHFVCIGCGLVGDVGACALGELEREVRRRFKGKVVSHIFQVNGLCGGCKGKEA